MNQPIHFKTTTLGVILLVCGLQLYGQQTASDAQAAAEADTITTFDVPGAGTGPGQGTNPTGINPAGVVTGYYQDPSGINHGFLREHDDGTITTFDPSGSQGTQATGINPKGVITGNYQDASFTNHGFLRARNGTFTTFDPPGSLGTFPVAINPAGATTGNFGDTSGFHGFLRSPNGVFTTFDPPSSASSSQTYPQAIEPAGAITGIYEDPSFLFHGFLRDTDGNFTTFDPPGSVYTQPYGINLAKTITGAYHQCDVCTFHSFLRVRDEDRDADTITTFDFPGSNQGTFALAINQAGTITGNYFTDQYHGFKRFSNGTFITFDPPGSIGTSPVAINPAGATTGYYYDASLIAHGFLREPRPRRRR